jgi:hypothetical protein
MIRLCAVLLVSLACNTAYASAWPWQGSTSADSQDYCMGLVVGGLSSKKVAGMSRSELWQAWSYLIRSGALAQMSPTDEYNAGRARFQEAADATAAEAVLGEAMGECGLGRSGHQITGW